MADYFMQDVLSVLPLKIENVFYDGNQFSFGGADWGFGTLSAWRIIRDKEIQFACYDDEVDDDLNGLKGLSIVAVGDQGKYIKVDPVFELSDGRQLEIFSTDTFEPWSMDLPNGKIYVADRGGATPSRKVE